jgi:hypothetical protein
MRTSRKKLDLEEIEQLAFFGSSLQEIAVHVDRDEAVLKKSRRCTRAIIKGWVRFNITLRRRMFELAVGGNINVLMFLHNNPPPLHALCAEHEELNKQLRFSRMATEREEWQRLLRGWSFAEGTGAADSDGTRHSDGLSSQSPE